MAERKPKENDAGLPFAALQLLAPPVRLVSAALWKVMKQRDVMQYGVVEEFVTSACETVPGLLTLRHQGKLALGLRGRFILELCNIQPDAEVIAPHLERICVPIVPPSSSASTVRKDMKIIRVVENFHSFVHTLLNDPAEREQFFKEQFPVDYGPIFDQELEKLFWEFLIRLDQLLPVPNLAQTVSWLNDAPPVLEECAHAATQPPLLKILLQHQTCLGNLESAASLPPNMGDSILTSLSLPPSGIIASNPQTENNRVSGEQLKGQKVEDAAPFTGPVTELISSDDIPVMPSSTKKAVSSSDETNEQSNPNENLKFTLVKQKQNTKDDGVEEAQEQPWKKRRSLNESSEAEEVQEQLEKKRRSINGSSGAEEPQEQPEKKRRSLNGSSIAEEPQEQPEKKRRSLNGNSEAEEVQEQLEKKRRSINGSSIAEEPQEQPEKKRRSLNESNGAEEAQEPEKKRRSLNRSSGAMEVQEQPEKKRRSINRNSGAVEAQEQPEKKRRSMSRSSGPVEAQGQPEKKRRSINGSSGAEEPQEQPEKKRRSINGSSGVKFKKADKRESFSDEEGDSTVSRTEVKKTGTQWQGKDDQRVNELEEDGAKSKIKKGPDTELLMSCLSKYGIKRLYLPEDSSFYSVLASCLTNQPQVVVEKLSVDSVSTRRSGRAGKSSDIEQSRKRKLTERSLQTSDCAALDNKENHPVLSRVSRSPSQRWSNTEAAALSSDVNDYVADSEDEATKNFKGRLFVKRYCKTKHGTYVPTLREFWKPRLTRRDWLVAGSKLR